MHELNFVMFHNNSPVKAVMDAWNLMSMSSWRIRPLYEDWPED